MLRVDKTCIFFIVVICFLFSWHGWHGAFFDGVICLIIAFTEEQSQSHLVLLHSNLFTHDILISTAFPSNLSTKILLQQLAWARNSLDHCLRLDLSKSGSARWKGSHIYPTSPLQQQNADTWRSDSDPFMHAPSHHCFRRALYIRDLEAMFPSEAWKASERERSIAHQQ